MWESTFTKSNTFIEVITEVNKEKEFKVKIEKVGKLIDVAVFLGIFHDRLFDNLMDRYEKTPDLFEYTHCTVMTMIFRKQSVETTKEKFLELLSFTSIYQINQFTYL